MGVDRGEWPVLVRLSLLGTPKRGLAWLWFWLTVALGIGCAVYSFVNPRFVIVVAIAVVGALHYYFSIRWVDRNSRWS